MKNIPLKIILKNTLCTLVLSLFFFSCQKIENTTYDEIKDDLAQDNQEVINEEFHSETSVTLVQLVSETEELSLLQEAFLKSNLETELNGEGPLTLFAPTNAAVEGLLDLLGPEYSSFEDFSSAIELELLNRILTYHIVEGFYDSDNLEVGEIPTLYTGNSIEVVIADDSFRIDDASEVDAKPLTIDKRATNGVLHIIDKILVPQDVIQILGDSGPIDSSNMTIKEFVLATEEFTFLKEALSLTGLLDVLGEEGPFTIFAPSNEAIIGLFGLIGDEFDDLEDFTTKEDIEFLREILLYHVIGEKLSSNNFIAGELSTLSSNNTLKIDGEEGEFTLKDGLQFEANIEVTDIPASNGFIHLVDRVLIPESVVTRVENQVASLFERVMLSTGDLDTALEFFRAVQDRMDLETLAEKEFTFFFPSDQAFLDLYQELGYDRIQEFNSDAGLEIVKTILSYHCVENTALKASDFQQDQILATFQGEELKVLLDNGVFILDKSGESSKLTIVDQNILNGLIHVVDKVLLPQEVIDDLSL